MPTTIKRATKLTAPTEPAVATLPGDTNEEVLIPFHQLFRDPLNVRKKAGASVAELAATILAQGLLQNLTVRPENIRGKPTGRLSVIAGGRRLEAIGLLIASGKLKEGYPVRCRVVSDDRALDISLAENSGREDLHGADLLDAFMAMKAQGRSIEQIADAWGLTPLTVQRRLRLADMAPELLTLYRNDGITIDQLMALSIIDEPALQWRTWNNIPAWNRHASAIRDLITRQDMDARHSAAVFVGLAAYRKAGGEVRADLFSEDERTAGTIVNPALMLSLAADKLAKCAPKVAGDGWTWVESKVKFMEYREQGYVSPRVLEGKPTAEQAEKLAVLKLKVDELERRIDDSADSVDDRDTDKALDLNLDLNKQHTALIGEIEDIQDRVATVLDPRDAAIVGVVVSLNNSGKPVLSRPLVRVADRVAAASKAPKDDRGAGNDDQQDAGRATRPEFSDSLARRLTCHRTAALRATVSRSPTVALRVLAFQLARQTIVAADEPWNRDRTTIALQASVADVSQEVPDMLTAPAYLQLEKDRADWRSILPTNDADLLNWCLVADDDAINRLLAFGAAECINAITDKTNRNARPLTDALAQAVGLDMRQWWTATGESFLSAVPKAKLIEAVTEAASPEAAAKLAGMKKAEAVASAEQQLAGTGWLPAPLRSTAAA